MISTMSFLISASMDRLYSEDVSDEMTDVEQFNLGRQRQY